MLSSAAVHTAEAHPDEDPPGTEQRDTEVKEVVGSVVLNDDRL